MLVLNPYPQTPFPGKGAILLGLPPLVPVGGYAPATPFLSTIEVFRQSETGIGFYRCPFQFVEKVCFFKKVLVLNPYPQTPFPGKGAILLGLPPLVPVGGYAPATPFLSTIEVFRQSETGIGIYRCPFFCLLPVESYVKPP